MLGNQPIGDVAQFPARRRRSRRSRRHDDVAILVDDRRTRARRPLDPPQLALEPIVGKGRVLRLARPRGDLRHAPGGIPPSRLDDSLRIGALDRQRPFLARPRFMDLQRIGGPEPIEAIVGGVWFPLASSLRFSSPAHRHRAAVDISPLRG